MPNRREPVPPVIPAAVDVVVIGSGLGGLTCALELARQGHGVAVFERHIKPGGYAHSFRRKNFQFDVSLHHVGGLDEGGMMSGILGQLGVLPQLTYRPRETLFTAEFPDLTVRLPNSPAELLAALVKLFPHEATGLYALFIHMRQLKYETVGEWLDPDFSVPIEERLSTLYRSSTLQDVLVRHVSDPKLLAIFGQLWMYIGLPPSLSSANFSACVFGASFTEGAHYIVGGGAALSKAMVDRLEELGSTCHTQTPVNRIVVEEGAAVGVELDTGQVVRAKAVISNANPYQTFFDLLPGDEVSRIYRYRLEQMEPSLSMYSTYIGLDCPPAKLGIDVENLFVNSDLDHDQAYRRVMEHDIDATSWCLTNYTRGDDTLSPDGTGIVSIVEMTPAGDWLKLDDQEYRKRKRAVHERLLTKYQARYPGLVEHAAVMEFGTPRTMYRYTRNHQGAVYGLAQTVQQANSKRLRNRAPIKGLFLTGAWTWAGGGYEGALMTGVQTAASVLQEFPTINPVARAKCIFRPDELPPLVPGATAASEEAVAGEDTLFAFRLPATAYGGDIDLLSAGRPSEYLRLIDRGRVEAIDSVCNAAGEESWLSRYVVNVYRIHITNLRPCPPGERVTVLTGLKKISSHRAAFVQRIVRAEDGRLLMDALVEVLFLDLKRQLVPVPDEFPGTPGPLAALDALSPKPMPFSAEDHFGHRVPFRIYYEDTDAQGIAYHVTYFRLCERALMDLLTAGGAMTGGNDTAGTAGPRLVSIDLRYLKASLLGDRLEIRTGGRSLGGNRLVLDQRVVQASSGTVVCDVIIELQVPGPQDGATSEIAVLRSFCNQAGS